MHRSHKSLRSDRSSRVQRCQVRSWNWWVAITGCMVLSLSFASCRRTENPLAGTTKFLAENREHFHSLGWLGARSFPVPALIPWDDLAKVPLGPGRNGIVLMEVWKGFPLDAGGLEPGDVILQVAREWLPINEDPTLDFVAAVEKQVSARIEKIELGYFRNGQLHHIALPVRVEPLDDRMPLPVARWSEMALACLRQLATQQAEDGSFPASERFVGGRLLATSICGLAFLAAEQSVREEFQPNIDRCLQYVVQHTDVDHLPREELHTPLIAAYVAQFVSEANVDVGQEHWLDVVGTLLEIFSEGQHESGGWCVAPRRINERATDDDNNNQSSDDYLAEEPDVLATFATNQVLLAWGAWVRMEMSSDNQTIEKGCEFIQQQSRLRVPARMDRRLKAALSAGSAAALIALNCDRNDVELRRHLEDGLLRARDVYWATSLGLPGLVHTSLAARQMGTESWLRFHEAVKFLLVVLCEPTGNVIEFPHVQRSQLTFETWVEPEIWRTAHVAITLSIQEQSLEKLLGLKTPADMIMRDSTGRQAQLNRVDANGELDKATAEALKKMIIDQLRARGMEVDESQLGMPVNDDDDDDDDDDDE